MNKVVNQEGIVIRVLNWVGRNWKVVVALLFAAGMTFSGFNLKCKYGELSKSSIDIPLKGK